MPQEKKNPPEKAVKGIPIVTASSIAGHSVIETKGLVWASTVRAKSIIKDLAATARVIAGGEVTEYLELVNEARHDIIAKLNRNAAVLGANAITDVRFATAQIVPGTVEILAYGTAVVARKG